MRFRRSAFSDKVDFFNAEDVGEGKCLILMFGLDVVLKFRPAGANRAVFAGVNLVGGPTAPAATEFVRGGHDGLIQHRKGQFSSDFITTAE